MSSEKYTAEFKITQDRKFAEDSFVSTTFGATTNEECAHKCDDRGETCLVYEFCESWSRQQKKYIQTCRMSAKENSVELSSSSDDENCNLYSKNLKKNDDQTKATLQPEVVWKKKFASAALSTVMSLILIALGAALGAVVYKKKFTV